MSRFKVGEILSSKERTFGTAVWNFTNLNEAVDAIDADEIVTVVKPEDDYGWVRILTPRGVVGVVHRHNIKRASS